MDYNAETSISSLLALLKYRNKGEKILMDMFWKAQSSTQDGRDPNISDAYLIVTGMAEPLLSAELGKTSCENGLFFTAV